MVEPSRNGFHHDKKKKETPGEERPRRFSVVVEYTKLFFWTLFIYIVAGFECVFGYRKKPKFDEQLFWDRVKQCLVKFHGMSEDRAANLIRDKHTVVDKKLLPYQEPFHIANDLAGFNLKLSPERYREEYLKGIMGK